MPEFAFLQIPCSDLVSVVLEAFEFLCVSFLASESAFLTERHLLLLTWSIWKASFSSVSFSLLVSVSSTFSKRSAGSGIS